MIKIGILAEYIPTYEPHVATAHAIEHAAEKLGIEASYEWVSTLAFKEDFFQTYHGLWVAPGSPYKSMENTLRAIRLAREQEVPTLGTCGGFQHVMIEYARNLLGMEDAQHAEYDPDASKLIISQLGCSLAGTEMALRLSPNSRAAEIYGTTEATERYYCNFALNPAYLDVIKKGPIAITGTDAGGEVRVVEYPDHPFFIATLFVPQTLSRPNKPHPLVMAFIRAVQESSRSHTSKRTVRNTT